jgi:hypothetical protein
VTRPVFFTIKFQQSDYQAITDYLNQALASNNYVRMKVSLSGTDVALDADLPVLCKDIQGATLATGAAGLAVQNSGELVDLDMIGIEVSDKAEGTAGNGVKDVSAYVWGAEGSQFFYVYITAMVPSTDWADEDLWPWIRIGLYNQLVTAGDSETTEICADVHDYSGIAKLLAVFDVDDDVFTVGTGTTTIGQFIAAAVTLRDLTKMTKLALKKQRSNSAVRPRHRQPPAPTVICALLRKAIIRTREALPLPFVPTVKPTGTTPKKASISNL